MAVTWDQVKEGDSLPELKKNCTTQQLVQWAAGSGDFYQIHYDDGFAKSTGLSGIIVHGALKNAFLGQLVHDWVGNNARIKKYGCSYRGMDLPNEDTLDFLASAAVYHFSASSYFLPSKLALPRLTIVS